MTTDEQMITRAIKLAQESFEAGDSPFGCVVAKGKKIIMETKNRMKLDDDITAHAEIRAIRQMQKKLGTSDLSDYTLYSNFEPCPMCSFMIREAKFRKVVFSLISRHMGGYSKWNILQDNGLERFAPFFAKPPIVVGGVLEETMKRLADRVGWTLLYKGFPA